MKKAHVPQDMNQEQVQNILKFIEDTQSDSVTHNIFSQLGYECFHARKLDKWILYKRESQQQPSWAEWFEWLARLAEEHKDDSIPIQERVANWHM